MFKKHKSTIKKAFLCLSILGFLGLSCFLYMYAQTRMVRFERYELPIKNLPASWEGKKVIQVSDIHASRYIDQKFIHKIFSRINNEQPDLILFTGDYISSDESYIKPLCAEASLLRTNLGNQGKIAIIGNHDCRLKQPLSEDQESSIGTTQRLVMASLENAGFTVLLNQHVEAGDKEKLIIAGLGDVWAKQAKPEETLQNFDYTNKPVLFLTHNPNLFSTLANLGDFTVLAGHTHGGQVEFPYKYQILNKKVLFLSGFFYDKGSVMYVSRGMGLSVAPIRLNCPAEVTVFTLVSGQ